MPKHKYEHNHTVYPEPEIIEVRGPSWRCWRRDWRFLAGVFLMMAAVAAYVMIGMLA